MPILLTLHWFLLKSLEHSYRDCFHKCSFCNLIFKGFMLATLVHKDNIELSSWTNSISICFVASNKHPDHIFGVCCQDQDTNPRSLALFAITLVKQVKQVLYYLSMNYCEGTAASIGNESITLLGNHLCSGWWAECRGKCFLIGAYTEVTGKGISALIFSSIVIFWLHKQVLFSQLQAYLTQLHWICFSLPSVAKVGL